MALAKLKLIDDRPEIIALKFTRGREVASEFNGEEMLYTLEDGRRFYAPIPVAQEIDSLHLAAGEEFRITKRRGGSYDVDRIVAIDAKQTRPLTAQGVEAARREETSREISTTTATTGQTGTIQDTKTARPYSEAARRMMYAYRDAFDVTTEVSKLAHTRGIPIQFETEDYRQIAAALFIEASKREARS